MGERRRKLIQNYEDAKLALLLDEYAEAYGKASTEQYKADLAAGRVKKISNQEAEAQLNAILLRAEEEEAKEARGSTRFKGVARKIATVAAAIAIFFTLMVTVQAAGIDVFGAVGRWTDSLFHFEAASEQEQSQSGPEADRNISTVEKIRSVLFSNGFSAVVTPYWIPEDYTISMISFPKTGNIHSVAFLLENASGGWVSYQSSKVSEGASFDDILAEKNDGGVETVISNDRRFYIFQNDTVWVGIYQDSEYRIMVQAEDKNTLTQIIKAIGGMPHD